MDHVLVTGGAGFIGSHTCKLLAKQGYKPVVFDNLSQGHVDFVKWGPLAKNSLSETSRLVRTIKEYKIKSVIHFAAFASVGESTAHPELYYANNVLGSLSLLQACQEASIENFIFSSSCATYGDPLQPTLDEKHPQNPVSPYGRTKLMTEKMLHDFCAVSAMKFVALRYFNAAGSSAEIDIGESHDPETHLIPNIVKAALGSGPELKVFGNDYGTQDGTCVRDYIHVDDLAQAHLKALKALEAKKQIDWHYNVGTGKGYSVLQLIHITEKLLGKKVPFQFAPRRKGDPASLVANAEKIKKDLDFMAEKTIEEMIHSCAEWMKKLRA